MISKELDPCYFCNPPKRTETCHGICKEYLKSVEEKSKIKKKKEQYVDVSSGWNYDKRGRNK